MAIAVRSAPGAGIEIPLAAFFGLMLTPNMAMVLTLLAVNKFKPSRGRKL
jgi:hypothetical protein